MDPAKPAPIPPVFVTYFSATVGNGLATLNLYAQAHEEIGASPKPVSVAALIFRIEEMRGVAAMIDDLLRQVGWTDPAPAPPPPPKPAPSSEAAPAAIATAAPAALQPAAVAPAPVKVRPLAPVFVTNFTGSYFDGMVVVSFFSRAEQEIGGGAVLIPVGAAAFPAKQAKALVTMINDLLRKGEMIVQLKDAPTSGVQ